MTDGISNFLRFSGQVTMYGFSSDQSALGTKRDWVIRSSETETRQPPSRPKYAQFFTDGCSGLDSRSLSGFPYTAINRGRLRNSLALLQIALAEW